jgi:glucose/arabinose dehydrogenase
MQLDRRTFLGAVGASTAAAVAAPLGTAEAAPRVSRVLATGMKVPWGMAFLPNGDALVTERVTAKVHRVRKRGGRRVVGRIAGVDTGGDQGEGGLLGCALSPSFAADRHVFFYLTSGNDNRVIRMTYADGGLSERTLVLDGITRGAATHDGGGLGFGPTGHLFISTGDARLDGPGDPASGSAAQDTSNLVGKTLRLNQDGSVPADNPFGNEVWTYGHRNVQGFDWDAQGRMWATEFGENDRDELNRIVRGANYGWPMRQGADNDPATRDPFATWHPTYTCSPSGIAVARNRAWVGALAGESLYSVRLTGARRGTVERHFRGRFGRVRTVRRAPDGSLWITTSNRDGRGSPARTDDRVIRIAI